jgi:hypothetical protein
MTSGGRTGASDVAASRGLRPGRPGDALGHPLRVALLGLLSRHATLTATEAARELGESSGACSFHLRQLERYGHIEAVPGTRGRVRPWRLATAPAPDSAAGETGGDDFGALARELENEGYRRWLAGRAEAPPGWTDAAFSMIVHLTPADLAELAEQVRALIAAFAAGREPGRGAGGGARQDAAAGTADVLPVAVVARMFPLLPAGPSA